jgi:hypothetical protein
LLAVLLPSTKPLPNAWCSMTLSAMRTMRGFVPEPFSTTSNTPMSTSSAITRWT